MHDSIAEEGEDAHEHWDEAGDEGDEDIFVWDDENEDDDDDDEAEQEGDSDAEDGDEFEDEDEQGDYEASC